MATYTPYEFAPYSFNLPGAETAWVAVMGTAYSANSNTITINNIDGTVTLAHGSFILANNMLVSGTVTSLQHTSGDGTIVYEDITGTSIGALQFVAASPAG